MRCAIEKETGIYPQLCNLLRSAAYISLMTNLLTRNGGINSYVSTAGTSTSRRT